MQPIRTFVLTSLLLAGLLVAGLVPAASADTVTVAFDRAADFEPLFRDERVDVKARSGVAQLALTDYVIHQLGNVISYTRFGGERLGRKVFEVDPLGASKAEVYVFHGPGEATFNGKPITFTKMGHGLGAWSKAEIPGSLLKQGRNELVFTSGFRMAQDLEHPRPEHSQVSTDGGKSWRPAEGEYLAHLRLWQHPAEGAVTSEVIDLANPQERDIIAPLIEVRDVEVTMVAQTPSGTAVDLTVRTGPTPRPDTQWSDWLPAEDAKPARFAQWRAVLRSENRRATPVLDGVTVTADVETLADPAEQPLKLEQFDNQRIIRSSHDYTHQRPSSKLTKLREMFDLDAVIAPGKTEMEQFVLLRNWIRRQWPHNDAGSGVRTWDAIEILSAPDGQHGMCVHYGIAMNQAALALGFASRPLILNGHFVCDVWSNEHGKWVLMDVETTQDGWNEYGTALYIDDRSGVPMGSWELFHAVASGDVGHIVQELYMVNDAGKHVPHERRWPLEKLRVFTHIAYTPRNDYLDNLEPWEVAHGQDHYHSNMYRWLRLDPTNNTDEYSLHTDRRGDVAWTVNQAELTLTATRAPDELTVWLDTVTPNFEAFVYRINGGEWRTLEASGDDPHERQARMTWSLEPGENVLEVRPRNAFGREGMTSRAVVERRESE